MFKCKHPFAYLAVEKEATTKLIDKDFTNITYHLYCVKCMTVLDLHHAKLNESVSEFLRGDK